jgi:hypothetical protein
MARVHHGDDFLTANLDIPVIKVSPNNTGFKEHKRFCIYFVFIYLSLKSHIGVLNNVYLTYLFHI